MPSSRSTTARARAPTRGDDLSRPLYEPAPLFAGVADQMRTRAISSPRGKSRTMAVAVAVVHLSAHGRVRRSRLDASSHRSFLLRWRAFKQQADGDPPRHHRLMNGSSPQRCAYAVHSHHGV